MPTGNISKKTLLLGLDLDYSHVNSGIDGKVAWFGSKKFWIDLYKFIKEYAARQNVEIVFAVISKKDGFDDICTEAASVFSSFLQSDSEQMYIERKSETFCLVECHGRLRYESLTYQRQLKAVPSATFSNFILLGEELKSSAILKLANIYGIPANQCMMVDDSPSVLADVEGEGIHPLSLHCFHDKYAKPEQLKDPLHVQKHLDLFANELKRKVDELIAEVKVHEKEEEAKTNADLQKVCDTLESFSMDVDQSVMPTQLSDGKALIYNDIRENRDEFIPKDNLTAGSADFFGKSQKAKMNSWK